MLFKTIVSKEGWELRLHEEHEIFKNPILKGFNLDEPVELYYCDLYLLAFNHTNYSLLSEEQVVNHLELLDKICFVNKQKELLDYAIANYHNDLDKWKSFINPSIVEIDPNYLLKFPDLIDYNLEEFTKLKNYDDLKRKKLLQYAKDDNNEAFSILFDFSLVNKKFIEELFKYGIKLVEFFVDNGFNNWNRGIYSAAKVGNKELIDFFINKGANNWNLGMIGAAEGGYKELIDFFIEKGANNWNHGMYGAALGGHKDIVDFFIDKGADDWNLGMDAAAEGDHKDLVDFFIDKGANFWYNGMYAAARGGHKNLVDFFIEKGADDWNTGMYYAAKGGHKDIVDFFIDKGANAWNSGLIASNEGGHKELIDFFISKGANYL